MTNWNGTTISYDANGNIQNDGTAAYSWNARNQLISRASTSFQYDSFGRRTLNANGKNLLYEGWDVGQELSGSTPVANRILGGTDEFFSRADSTGTYAPITDALGSALALTIKLTSAGAPVLPALPVALQPFNLPEALQVSETYLARRQYIRAAAVLGDATERYPENADAEDLLVIAHAPGNCGSST